MFLRYLRRELTNRKKQTAIIAVGMALAIALVIIVSSFASAVRGAQDTALQSVYGVGTDITVAKTPTAPADGQRPNITFDPGSGSTSGSSGSSGDQTNLSQSRLRVAMGAATMASSSLATAQQTAGVSNATGVLQLENIDFSGTVTQNPSSGSGTAGTGTAGTGTGSTGTGSQGTGQGGPRSFGGGSFSVNQTSVEGIPVSGELVGPMTNTTTAAGRAFADSDAGADVAILDQTYATTASKSVNDTITLGDTPFTIIGIVASTDSSSATASNVYIPLDTAQTLAGEADNVTAIYVSATSSADVDAIKSALETALPDTTVSTEADLASSISGSLSTASNLISTLGKWLSIAVLAAAFLIAILFTISGVTRRTREFGTLKAIGWSNGRITRQVAAESVVQGVIGGLIGAAMGLVGILILNIASPTISGSVARASGAANPGSGGAGGAPSGVPAGGEGGGQGGFGRARTAASTATNVVLHAPVMIQILLLAIGLAIVGGLLAGALGGWRASRLRPAEALRSVA